MFKASYISRLYGTLCLAVLLATSCKKTAVNTDSIGTIYIGSNNGYVHAVRASDGKALGVYKSPRNLYTTIDPIVYNNTLYATDDSTHIYALDAISGTPKWLQPFDIKTVYNANYGYINAPLFYPIISNNILYITYVDKLQTRKQIFAVDLATGQAMKNFNGIIKDGRQVPTPTEPIVVHKGAIYSVCQDTLYIIDAITGNLKTGYTPTALKGYTNGLYTTPIIHNNVLYLGARDGNMSKLYAVDANNGTIMPGYPINIDNNTFIIGISRVYNNTLYLTGVKDISGNKIYAVDINTKSLKSGFQIFDLNYKSANVNSHTVVVEDGIICIGSSNNHMVYGIDANSGAKLWEFDAQGTVSSSSVVYKGTIYIGGATALYALDLKTGTKKWEYLTKGEVSSNPCLVTNDGKILAKTVNAED